MATDRERLTENALGPKKVTEGDTTVEQHSVDPHAVVKDNEALAAVSQSPTRGFRIFQWSPPSALG